MSLKLVKNYLMMRYCITTQILLILLCIIINYEEFCLQMLKFSREIDGHEINRPKLEDLLKQRFFYDMSFSVYGGT